MSEQDFDNDYAISFKEYMTRKTTREEDWNEIYNSKRISIEALENIEIKKKVAERTNLFIPTLLVCKVDYLIMINKTYTFTSGNLVKTFQILNPNKIITWNIFNLVVKNLELTVLFVTKET